MRGILVTLVCFTCLYIHAAPVFSFTAESVTASGLTPGRDGVSMAVLREAKGYEVETWQTAEVLHDADQDGVVTVLSGRRIPWHSLFVVVDLATGSSIASSPHPELVNIQQERLIPGQVRKLIREGEWAIFLLVRPKVGAWTLTIHDSGRADDDPKPDGKVGLSFDRMTPLGDAPAAPTTLERSDVIFVIDPLTLSLVELRGDRD